MKPLASGASDKPAVINAVQMEPGLLFRLKEQAYERLGETADVSLPLMYSLLSG